jgi:phosphatidylglycerophosphate synthase
MDAFLEAGARPVQARLEGAGQWFVENLILPFRVRFPKLTWMTRANTITVTRALLVFPIVYGVVNHRGYAFVLFVIAALTDLLDGWVARHDGSTKLGKVLDSTTDKVLTLSALGAVLYLNVFPWWFDIVVISMIVLDTLGMYANVSNFLRDRVGAPAKAAAKATYRVGARFGTLPGKVKFWALCIGTCALMLAHIVWPEWLWVFKYLGYFALMVAVPLAAFSLPQKFA